ncbi:hypothetical protein [Vulcanisaeta souniana]|uniref:hypothetical protein n=1 Tax=Vulcanisaeta souniana TaxID=164452 RepID=UPI000A92FC60|nr:hypothetical protein [Vulcanisaeta souniana]
MNSITEYVMRHKGLHALVRLLRKPDTAFGLVILALFYAWSIIEGALQVIGLLTGNPALGWKLLPYNPFQPHLSHSLQPPSLAHIMAPTTR